MNNSAMEHYIITNLDKALEKRWITPYFQPFVRTITGNFSGGECLARWIDPVYGIIMPGTFVPVLEKAGLIYKIDLFMVKEVARIQRQRIDAGLPVGLVTVNFSRQDFDKLDVASFIHEQIDKYGISKDLIALELTESMLVKNKEKMISVVKDLRSEGFQIWMDDFGSGYSSLIFLNDYQLDVIKLDMAFLKSFSNTSMEIMRSTVNLAKKLGIRTLAEGVEAEEHVRFLTEIGCDMMQGFYLTKPVSCGALQSFFLHSDRQSETMEWKKFYDQADACVINSDAPRAVVEYDIEQDHSHYLFINQNEKEQLRSLGRKTKADSEFVLNNKNNPLHPRILECYDRAIHSSDTVTAYVSDNSCFLKIACRMVARYRDHCILLLTMINITNDRTHKIGQFLDKSLSDIVLLFDDVHILNPEQDTADNLINNFGIDAGLKNQDDLRKGLKFFCCHMVHPKDRERYWKFADPDTMIDRILKTSDGILREYFRILNNAKDGESGYVWKEFNLLLIPGSDNKRILSCIKDATPTSDDSCYLSETDKLRSSYDRLIQRNIII